MHRSSSATGALIQKGLVGISGDSQILLSLGFHFAFIAKSLYEALQAGNTPSLVSQVPVFETLKEKLLEAPTLALLDMTKPF